VKRQRRTATGVEISSNWRTHRFLEKWPHFPLLELLQDALELSGRELAPLRVPLDEVDEHDLYVLECCIVERVLRRHPIDRKNLRCSLAFFACHQIERVGIRQADVRFFGRDRFTRLPLFAVRFGSRFSIGLPIGLSCVSGRGGWACTLSGAVVVIAEALQFALLFIVLVVPGARTAGIAFFPGLSTENSGS